jgi:hypothetical protein
MVARQLAIYASGCYSATASRDTLSYKFLTAKRTLTTERSYVRPTSCW